MPDGPDLLSLFPPAAAILAEARLVPAIDVPEPYHALLVHRHHMTVTVEAHHGCLVNVVVLDRQVHGEAYCRKILLARQSDGRVVQFGLVRIHLRFCTPEARAEILSEKTPLGRVLITHNVLRHIEPTAFLRVTPGPDMAGWFNLEQPQTTYGRLAVIHCDGRPAIEVLEVVAPEPAESLQ